MPSEYFMKFIVTKILQIILLISLPLFTFADSNVTHYKKGIFNCIASNGTPNHEIGKFPTKGNPNKFKVQEINYCFPSDPIKKNLVYNKASTVGITLTGIPIRPGTADW